MSHNHSGGDEHLGSLTGAYALDALDPLERARVERHLGQCDACVAEVRSFQETAGRLAAGVATAPPVGLRDRVLADVTRTRQLPPRVEPGGSSRHGGARLAWVAAAAAALLVATAGLGAVAWRESGEARRARALVAAVSDVLTDPQRRVVTTEFADGQGSVLVAGNRVVLIADQVAAPPEDRVFQLWFVGEDGPRPSRLLSAAGDERFWVEADGLRPGDAVAVTVEPAGGSEQPTSDPVLVATPQQG